MENSPFTWLPIDMDCIHFIGQFHLGRFVGYTQVPNKPALILGTMSRYSAKILICISWYPILQPLISKIRLQNKP